METNINNHIQRLVKEGEETPAGIWQANELFQDEIMLVLYNADIEIAVPDSIPHMRLLTKSDHVWADEHFEERVGGKPTNPGESYKRWPYNKKGFDGTDFMDNQQFSHTYQERFWPPFAGGRAGQRQGIRYYYGDLDDVIKQLHDNKLTRQAYLPIFFPEDTGAVHKQRVPCTLGYQFYIRQDTLNVNYYIRSCDALRHFRNDVYLAMRLLYYIGTKLPYIKRMGQLRMYITNFHVFKNDLYALKKKETKLGNKWQE